MITDEWPHNMRTRCTLGDTERLKIDGRGMERVCDTKERRRRLRGDK